MMIPLAHIPYKTENKFKSKEEIAKRVAYTFNRNKKQPIQTVYNGCNISLKLNPHDNSFTYKNGSFSQKDSKDICYLEDSYSNSHVEENKRYGFSETFRKPKNATPYIFIPYLFNCNKVSKTFCGENPAFPISQIIDFAQNIDENSSPKRQEFKKQVKFFEYKKEFFDIPVKYATKVALMEDAKNNKRISLDIGNGGIANVRKKDDLVDLYYAHYWCNRSILFKGYLTLLRDENGIPLKEDENGNILNNNDKNYNNPKNKLCFDIDLHTSSVNRNIHTFNFKRKVDLKADIKERNRLYLEERNKHGRIVSSVYATIPKYSESWIQQRFPKAYYDTFKSDLKVIKEVLTSQKLDPQDLNIQY